MAIVNNLWLRGTKKRLAGTVVYQSMGQTIQRELASQVSNPRTEAQMQQRVRWANIVALYRVLRPMMRYAFEGKKRTQSDYNAFMSANITSSPIALTKQEAAAGACVVAPYTITRGTLPSITLSASDNGWLTDIFTGEFDDFADATVGEFAKAVIDNNPGIQRGDQLSIIRLTQMMNDVTGIPYVVMRKFEILMDTTSPDLVVNYLPVDILAMVGSEEQHRIEVKNNGRTGAFAVILSRTISGRTMVSTQQLQPVNMDEMLAAYSSPEQVAGAIASYGESDDAFLSTTEANYGENQPKVTTILSLNTGKTSWLPGSYAGNISQFRSKQLFLLFNETISAPLGEMSMITDKGSHKCINRSIDGEKLLFSLDTRETYEEDEIVTQVITEVAGVTYSMSFRH